MLDARDLAKTFRHAHGHTRVLDGVSLKLEPGQRLGLTGPSGVGKTTLAMILAMLTRPDTGTISVDGRTIAGVGLQLPARLRRRVQLLWQAPRAAADPRMSLRALVREPAQIAATTDEVESTVATLADQVGLTVDLLDRHPHEVSEGQLQRACVARALAARPGYLLADEPGSMLDASSQASVLQAIADAQQRHGIGVLLITHDQTLADHWCDTVVGLDELHTTSPK